MFERKEIQLVISRIKEPRKFLQVIVGARQIGKTTLVKQALQKIDIPYIFYSADNVAATDTSWISNIWNNARITMKAKEYPELLLVIDEIQKINLWSEAIKKEWDSDTFNDVNIKVLLLGSSRVLLEKGLADSMMGRFEQIRLSHWTFEEMKQAFGFTLEQYIFFGAYPGSAVLIDDEQRWRSYINSSIIDATINKDILIDTPISKPALLRQTFELASAYSGNILSLTKMLGRLQDAGNTVTLSSYLQLLNESGMVTGLQKFANDKARVRASIPKYQVYNNALKNVYTDGDFYSNVTDHKRWGNIFESCVGSHIISQAFKYGYKVYYWRDGNDEVDFVLKQNSQCAAIEVKSNAEKTSKGLNIFKERYKPINTLIVGKEGMPIEDFLSINPQKLLV